MLFLGFLIAIAPFAFCIWMATKDRGPRKPDGMNTGM
jgi:hypothetical protein